MQKVATTQADDNRRPKGVSSIYPPILLLLVIGLLVYWTYGYGETARRLPLLISFGALALSMLDLISRLRGKAGSLIRLALGAGFQDPEMKHDPVWQSEILHVIWVAGCVLGMALIGILATIPLFIFLYMVLQGKQKILFSVTIATLVVLMVGIIFEIFLEYDLYGGMLLNRDGFE